MHSKRTSAGARCKQRSLYAELEPIKCEQKEGWGGWHMEMIWILLWRSAGNSEAILKLPLWATITGEARSCAFLCAVLFLSTSLFPLLSMPKSVLKTVSIKALTLFQICNIVLIITWWDNAGRTSRGEQARQGDGVLIRLTLSLFVFSSHP